MNDAWISLSMGAETETLLQDILDDVDDALLDELEITRRNAPSEGLVGEPVTVAALIGAGTAAMVALLRIVERKMEHNRQLRHLEIIAEGFEKDAELGEILGKIAKKHADVSVRYGLSEEAWPNRGRQ